MFSNSWPNTPLVPGGRPPPCYKPLWCQLCFKPLSHGILAGATCRKPCRASLVAGTDVCYKMLQTPCRAMSARGPVTSLVLWAGQIKKLQQLPESKQAYRTKENKLAEEINGNPSRARKNPGALYTLNIPEHFTNSSTSSTL